MLYNILNIKRIGNGEVEVLYECPIKKEVKTYYTLEQINENTVLFDSVYEFILHQCRNLFYIQDTDEKIELFVWDSPKQSLEDYFNFDISEKEQLMKLFGKQFVNREPTTKDYEIEEHSISGQRKIDQYLIDKLQRYINKLEYVDDLLHIIKKHEKFSFENTEDCFIDILISGNEDDILCLENLLKISNELNVIKYVLTWIKDSDTLYKLLKNKVL